MSTKPLLYSRCELGVLSGCLDNTAASLQETQSEGFQMVLHVQLLGLTAS